MTNDHDPHGVFDDVLKSIPNTTRDLPMPYDHLVIDGPTVADREISRDIISTLSHLVGMSSNGPVDVQTTPDGTLKVAVTGSSESQYINHTFISGSSGTKVGAQLQNPVNKIYGYVVSAAVETNADFQDAFLVGVSGSPVSVTPCSITHQMQGVVNGTKWYYTLDQAMLFPTPIDVSLSLGTLPYVQQYIVSPSVATFYLSFGVLYGP